MHVVANIASLKDRNNENKTHCDVFYSRHNSPSNSASYTSPDNSASGKSAESGGENR